MEVIRVPHVSLVDCFGKKLGTYNDSAGWWDETQSKRKHEIVLTASHTELNHHQNNNKSRLFSGKVSPMQPSDNKNNNNLDFDDYDDDDFNDDEFKSEVNNIFAADYAEQMANEIRTKELAKEAKNDVLGESLLHIAIMYDDMQLIKFLIEKKGYSINLRCISGKFSGGFNGKLTSKLIKESEYEMLAYYGEYPLALAACFASKDTYDYLISRGADPNLPDSNGNTVMHTLVINDGLSMFHYAYNHMKKKGSLDVKNNQGLTPLNLAAKIGKEHMFELIIDLRKTDLWEWSTTECACHPLDSIDTLQNDGSLLTNSALSYIVNGESKEHLEMLNIEIVDRLLSDKWAHFGQRRFIEKLILACIHLICLSIAIYTRKSDDPYLAINPTTAVTWVRYITEIIVALMCLVTFINQLIEIYKRGLVYYLRTLFTEPANILYQVFCILVIIAIPCRIAQFAQINNNTSSAYSNAKYVEDTLIILAAPFAWGYMFFFAGTFEVTGPFIAMIYKMIVGDIITFFCVFSFQWFGFSLASYYIYKNSGSGGHIAPSDTTFTDYGESLLINFLMTLGDLKDRIPELDFNLKYYTLNQIVFVLFLGWMHILLYNLLIAMMGNTYHLVLEEIDIEYKKSWSKMVLLLERTLSAESLKKHKYEYCINLPNSDPNKKEDNLNLLIISQEKHTKAHRRAMAIKNYKKLLRAILKIFKTKNINSEQLLAQWKQGKVVAVKIKKEKKVFSWSDYPSMKLNDGYSKLVEDHKNNTVQILSNDYNKEPESDKAIVATKTETKSKTPQPPAPAKSPVPPPPPPPPPKPPTPVKIISNGETKKMLTPEPPKAVVQPPPPPPEPEPKQEPEPVQVEQPKETELIQQITTTTSPRPNSGARPPISRPSTSKKAFFPNQTNRVYSPVANYLANDDNTEGNDLSNIKRPPSSAQKDNPDSYIKNETYPQFPLNSTLLNESNNNQEIKSGADGVSMQSIESGSVSIKPTLSPDSDNDKLSNNDSIEKTIDE